MRNTHGRDTDRPPASLRVPLDRMTSQLATLISRGHALLESQPGSAESVQALEHEEDKWADFGREVLRRGFSTDEYEQQFWRKGGFRTTHDDPGERLGVMRDRLSSRIAALESIRDRLELIDAPEHTSARAPAEDDLNLFSLCLQQDIIEQCGPLFRHGHYAESVERSFKVVRERLRKLTGYEKGSDAFGSGKLHVKGAADDHVDEDFNAGVKFLMMAIDRFRNEKSHSAKIGIREPSKALQYLILSSLALRLLDGAEIRK